MPVNTQAPQQVEDLLIKGEELIQLNGLLEQIPTKWGFGLVAFFQSVGVKRSQEKAEAAKTTPVGEVAGDQKPTKSKNK